MSNVDTLAKSLSALSRDDRIALVEKLSAGLGPNLNAASDPQTSVRMRKLSAAMDVNSVALKNATAELKRLRVPYSGETGVDVGALQAAMSTWSPEKRIELKAKLAAVGLMD